ncbi:MFS general substrate transporter [Lophiostoma macrostomum CBS 122681]|uniref:MFS general substrate transporter n=1 Tax=Lophiostoma macrostomum CBS 122681 TaxID=1314788 RepID=A0A6A6TC47_9PLEO|nr:MFS general substrate transporter [Lophiostoma macrostomum CBS 122681]
MTDQSPNQHTDDVVLQNLDSGLHQTDSPVAVQSAIPSIDRRTLLQLLVAGFSYFFAGGNDGSLGSVTPYILRTYGVGTQYVAIIYTSTFLGWVLAAVTNSYVAQYLELGSILTLGAIIQLVAQLPRCWIPPFPLFIVTFFVQAWGMGYQDAHANAFAASLAGAHRLLGFIHAMYALGALVSPFVVTTIASRVDEGKWQLCYLFLVGVGVVNVLSVPLAFRDTLRFRVQRNRPEQDEARDGEARSRSQAATRDLINTLKSPPVYLLSLFYFTFMGVAITAGGWVVEYLIAARNGTLPSVGYVTSGMWGGIFLGRLLLAEPTHKLGERRMVFSYCVAILALQLVFWLVPNLISGAVAISFLGVFIGPMFATGMSIASRLFPDHIRPTALGIVFVLAQAGGALFPAITGVIASKAGVKVLQPMLLGLIIAMGIAWALVPRVKKRDE